MVINILSNRSKWTFYFLQSVQVNFTIGKKVIINISNKSATNSFIYPLASPKDKPTNKTIRKISVYLYFCFVI
ncbi:hypothetical protein EFR45_00385 [Lactobacillus crispatus]|nr:hypothetical protein [Lactobacillus crispatus]